MCNGHDISEIFAYVFNSEYGDEGKISSSITKTCIENSLRANYD